jgi:hypothetical protein
MELIYAGSDLAAEVLLGLQWENGGLTPTQQMIEQRAVLSVGNHHVGVFGVWSISHIDRGLALRLVVDHRKLMLWLPFAARNVQVYPCLLGLSLHEIVCSRKLEDKNAVVRCDGRANKFSIAVFEVRERT